ncbi:MAG TPA: hypothetical protein VIO56_00135 [Methylotenera sp.]
MGTSVQANATPQDYGSDSHERRPNPDQEYGRILNATSVGEHDV